MIKLLPFFIKNKLILFSRVQSCSFQVILFNQSWPLELILRDGELKIWFEFYPLFYLPLSMKMARNCSCNFHEKTLSLQKCIFSKLITVKISKICLH